MCIPNLEDHIDELCSSYFRMSRVDGSYSIEPLRLMKDGSIYGHSHQNEYSWKIINGRVAFLSKDGRVSTLFDDLVVNDGKLLMSGNFLLRPQLSIRHKLQQIDYSWESRERFKLLTKELLKEGIKKHGWEIGDHTYGQPQILEPRMAALRIGKFCSIASGVTIILGNHRTDSVTTYPFSTLKKHWPGIIRSSIEDHTSNGDVNIGNDVWIGRAATIMSGVTVGNGAVIAANSLVNKNVAPYAIVGGTPAKLLKFRHSPQVISDLLIIKWWDWDDELIDSRLPEILSDVETFVNLYK